MSFFRSRSASSPPPPRRPPPRIEWLPEELSYGHFVQRAWRVFDGDGAVILHLVGPELDLRVGRWTIVAGDVDDAGGVRVTVRCESPARYGKEFQLSWEPGTRRWSLAGTILDGPALAVTLTRLAGGPAVRASLDVDDIVDAIGPYEGDDRKPR